MNSQEQVFKPIFMGYMKLYLDGETLADMKEKSVFKGHWATRTRKVMKKGRKYRINLYLYNVEGELEHDVAQFANCGNGDDIWEAIKVMANDVFAKYPDTKFDKERSSAVVRA